MVFALVEFFGAGADYDAAASGFGQGPGGVGVHLDCLLGGGGCVGAGQAAQVAFGDLADEGVVEDELGAERGVGTETGERLVQVLLAGFGVLGLDAVRQRWSQLRMPSTAWAGPTRAMGIWRGPVGESASAGPNTLMP
ncbi:hypothetical protein SALBM311S_02828 [Streptomyces alboniger]